MTKAGSAQLLTSLSLITYLTALKSITIDLVFVIKAIANRFLECRTALKLDYSSDHQPVNVQFQT